MAWARLDGLRVLGLDNPGETRDWLNERVLGGHKQATAGLLGADYQAEGEPLEHVGELLALVDSQEQRIGTVEVTKVEVVPFAAVDWAFAQAEGEGFRSVEHWREVHTKFFTDNGARVEEDTQVVCMHFRLLP
ncbi:MULTISPECIES: ASCH domain-containing protein [unclassified Crossiella]|uniref:ASCH domain-containing protein n=1 Tax=unclassified Crossiella TaxID=2620835 RepID=UPI0020005114|nr:MULTISPECIES: ASCH domain-containing protein [unclassified Crossiella]MCK2237748.1 ASCH domain-containing protein [Crossiella sp. S99.2]MCK2255034.1 ASCH domain-containing protein [Crossiella sp. S99.1]